MILNSNTKSHIIKLTVFLCPFFLQLANTFADEKVNSEFTITKGTNENEPLLKLQFKDGREIISQVSTTPVHWITVKLNQTETLCTSKPEPTNCTLILPLVIRGIKTKWSQHPDPSKIGKAPFIKYNKSAAPSLLIQDDSVREFISIEAKQMESNPSQINNENAVFTCDNYSWLTNNSHQSLPKWLSLQSWSAESNQRSIETQVNENQTISGAFNLSLTGVWGQSYLVSDGRFFVNTSGSVPLVGNGPVTIVNRDEKNQLCQSTFSSSLGQAIVVVNEMLTELKTTPGKNGLMNISQFQFILNNLENLKSFASSSYFDGEFL